MDAQQELQKIMYQIDIYKNQIETINEQINMIDATIKSMESTIEALTSLNKTDVDREILLPLGSNAFAHSKLSDNQNVIVGVGANIFLEKSIPEAVKFFDTHIEELHAALAKMQKKSAEIENQLIQLNNIGEHLVKETQGMGQI